MGGPIRGFFLGTTKLATWEEVSARLAERGFVWLWIDANGAIEPYLRRGDIVEWVGDGVRSLWRGHRAYRLDRAPWRWLAGRERLWRLADVAYAVAWRTRSVVDQLRPLPEPAAEAAEEARAYRVTPILEAYADSADEGLTDLEARLIDGSLRSGDRILVVGCGAGRECMALVKRGVRTTGIDVCEEMIARARQAVPDAHFEAASLVGFDMTPASFDAVLIASDVYAHVPGRAGRVAALARVREALRPGGVVWIAAHAGSESFIKRLAADTPRRLLGRFLAGRVPEPGDRFTRAPGAPWPRYHHRFASDAEIEREIAEAGFMSVERVEGFFQGRTPAATDEVPRYRARTDVQASESGGDLILVQLSHGHACALNPTARQIWDLALTGLSVEDIARCLHRRTGAAEERIARDARELLESLAAGSLLNRVVARGVP